MEKCEPQTEDAHGDSNIKKAKRPHAQGSIIEQGKRQKENRVQKFSNPDFSPKSSLYCYNPGQHACNDINRPVEAAARRNADANFDQSLEVSRVYLKFNLRDTEIAVTKPAVIDGGYGDELLDKTPEILLDTGTAGTAGALDNSTKPLGIGNDIILEQQLTINNEGEYFHSKLESPKRRHKPDLPYTEPTYDQKHKMHPGLYNRDSSYISPHIAVCQNKTAVVSYNEGSSRISSGDDHVKDERFASGTDFDEETRQIVFRSCVKVKNIGQFPEVGNFEARIRQMILRNCSGDKQSSIFHTETNFEEQICRMLSSSRSMENESSIIHIGENFEEQVRNILVSSLTSDSEGDSRRNSRGLSSSDLDSESIGSHAYSDQTEPAYPCFEGTMFSKEVRDGDDSQNDAAIDSLYFECHSCAKSIQHKDSIICPLCGINSSTRFCDQNCRFSCGNHWEWCGLGSFEFRTNTRSKLYIGPLQTKLHINPYRFWNSTILFEYPRFDFCLFKWGLIHNEAPHIKHAIVFDDQILRNRFHAVYKRAHLDSDFLCVLTLLQVVRAWVKRMKCGVSNEEVQWQFSYEFPEVWPCLKNEMVSDLMLSGEEWVSVENHLARLLHKDGNFEDVIPMHEPLVGDRFKIPSYIRDNGGWKLPDSGCLIYLN